MKLAHPLLFVLFLLLSAFTEVRPYGSMREALACLPVLLLAAAGLFMIFRLITRQAGKAALLATVLLVFLGLSGELAGAMAKAFKGSDFPLLAAGRWSLALLAVPPLILMALIFRAKRDLGAVNQAVTMAMTALLLMTAATPLLDRRDAAWRAAVAPPTVRLETPGRPPDIYYLVLDSYTSLDYLRDYWGYDSADLRRFLRDTGFQTAPGARSEYKCTTFCLASRLNMDYPPPVFCDWDERYTRNVMVRIIEDSAAPAMLKAAGYRIVNLSMMSLGEAEPRYPITTFLCFSSVNKMLRNRSFLSAVKLAKTKVKTSSQGLAARKRLPFSDIEAAAREPSDQPRFVFSHLMISHAPMVFRRDGSVHPITQAGSASNGDYLDQTIYATHLLTQTVARILAHASQPPVIIIQGDHGFRYFQGTEEQRRHESYGMLNAMLIPGLTNAAELEALPPVNTFRLVFNHVFNAGLPYLTNSAVKMIERDIGDD
jgi:hypothetical protein